jgi:pimeloyl-ACP methyl ester carboxylesterase
MAEIFDLEGRRVPIELPEAGITLLAPGLLGRGSYEGKRELGRVRALTREKTLLDEALAETELEDRHSIILEAPTPTPTAARSSGSEIPDDEIELRVESSEATVQFVVYADEDGVLSLHFPERRMGAEKAPGRAARGSRIDFYRIRLRRAGGNSGGSRGIIGAAAHKLIKIIVGKALEGAARLGEFAAVRLWERKARSDQGFHSGDVSRFLSLPPLRFSDWQVLSDKRSLLFIHGTTSTTWGAFDGIKGFPAYAAHLWNKYEGRVLGFDHHTLTKKVAENVIDFYEGITSPGTYEFDVVAHSRGGLVARAIAEMSDEDISVSAGRTWSRPKDVNVKFRRIVFVGTPNNGTDLADPKNLPTTLDRLANAVHLLPDAPLTIALGAILAAAAYVSETGLTAIPGLVEQAPGSQLLRTLNVVRTPRIDSAFYRGIEAEFRPTGGIGKALLNKGLDRAFHEQANDIVVPTLGVSLIGSSGLPEGRVKKFSHDDGVYHTSFFSKSATWEFICSSLDIPLIPGN